MEVETGDLSDFDIHCILEALQTRKAKTVAECALSIKILLLEIQQQLLDQMIEAQHKPDSKSSDYCEDSSGTNHSNDLMGVLQETSNHDGIQGPLSLSSFPVPPSKVPITGQLRKVLQPQPCPDCGKFFQSGRSLDRHKARCQKGATLSCSADGADKESGAENDPNDPGPIKTEAYENGDIAEIIDNNQQVKGRHRLPKRMRCPVCNIETLSQHMQRHMMKHTGDKPFECENCGKRFNRKDKLKEHARRHTQEYQPRISMTVFKCSQCDFSSTSPTEKREHLKMHPKRKAFTCTTCQASFNVAKQLEMHARKHTGERPFMCHVCGQSFMYEVNLKRHIKEHNTKEAPFTCKFCGKAYYRRGDLTIHERQHTGEKPYACEICGTAFRAGKHLKRHKQSHTGLKPYKCDICNKCFSRPENMKAHRKIHDKANTKGLSGSVPNQSSHTHSADSPLRMSRTDSEESLSQDEENLSQLQYTPAIKDFFASLQNPDVQPHANNGLDYVGFHSDKPTSVS